jgi:RNA polymerase sigma-70 factor (ECF subfamily)
MPLSLEQIYDAHADALYAFLLNCSRDHMLVQDALQEVFLKLARSPSLVEKARDPRSFLLRTAHNALRDLARRSSVRTAYEEKLSVEAPTLLLPLFPGDDDSFRIAVETALQDLPQHQRAVLHLKLWENLTFAQIAEALEISPHTAASRYRYALDKLRDVLRPVYAERL